MHACMHARTHARAHARTPDIHIYIYIYIQLVIYVYIIYYDYYVYYKTTQYLCFSQCQHHVSIPSADIKGFCEGILCDRLC